MHIVAHTTPGNLTLVWLRCRQIVKQEADVSAALAAQLPKADLKNTLGRAVNPGGDFQVIPAVAALNAAVDANAPPAALKSLADSAIVLQHSQPDSLGAATSGSNWLQVRCHARFVK